MVAAPVTGPRGWLSFQARFHSVIPKLRVFVHFHLQAQQVDPYFVLQRSWIRSSFGSFASAKCEFLACRLKKKLWIDRMSCVFYCFLRWNGVPCDHCSCHDSFFSQVWNRQRGIKCVCNFTWMLTCPTPPHPNTR